MPLHIQNSVIYKFLGIGPIRKTFKKQFTNFWMLLTPLNLDFFLFSITISEIPASDKGNPRYISSSKGVLPPKLRFHFSTCFYPFSILDDQICLRVVMSTPANEAVVFPLGIMPLHFWWFLVFMYFTFWFLFLLEAGHPLCTGYTEEKQFRIGYYSFYITKNVSQPNNIHFKTR